MKNLSLALNIILLLAVGFLFVKHFQGPKVAEPASTGAAEAASGFNIVYINEDSLLNKYEYFVEKTGALQQKERTASNSLQQKGRAIEQEVRSIQAKVQQGLLAPNQIAREEQRIGQQQQQLVQEQERMSQELLLETQQLNQELQADVKEVLTRLKDENGYDYVLSYGSGSGVLMVNEALDITNKVVELLNAKRPAAGQ